MRDPYANYFFQRLSKLLNNNQRLIIIKNLAHDFASIASDNYGTHALQSLFETVNLDSELKLLTEMIKPSFLSICKVRYHIFYSITFIYV